MERIRYAAIFERYIFGNLPGISLRDLPPEKTLVRPFSSDVSQLRADWLEHQPRLVLKLCASWRRCLVLADEPMLQQVNWLGKLPASAADLHATNTHRRLQSLCQDVYQDEREPYVLADLVFYCTRRALRLFPVRGRMRVTRRNVNEIVAEFAHEGVATDPDYILANGPAFACYRDKQPVGFCGCHSSPMMEKIGNVGMVFVEKPYRRQGIAKALVSHVTKHLLDAGRVPVYGCSGENVASARTAQAVGYKLRGYRCRILGCDDSLHG